MHNPDNGYYEPAVPPLYPMDPCRKKPYYDDPIYYDPVNGPYDMNPVYNDPYYTPQPVNPHMPNMDYSNTPYMNYPVMDPYLRQCMEVCMRMRCGHYSPYYGYPDTSEYSSEEYEKFKYIDLHKLSPYYIPEEK